MKIRITPGALLLLFVMAVRDGLLFPATLLAAAWHELGHILAAQALSVPLKLLELDIPGARLVPAGALPSYRTEALLAGAGPVASFLLALLTLPLRQPFFVILRATTLSLGVFNLLPVGGFDGGRVLFGLLAPRVGERAARGVLEVGGYLSLLLLFALSACLLLRYGQSLSLAVLCASLFARTFLLDACPSARPKEKRGF